MKNKINRILIKKELIDILENYKLSIEVYFQNNISDSEEHDKLLKYFNTK